MKNTCALAHDGSYFSSLEFIEVFDIISHGGVLSIDHFSIVVIMLTLCATQEKLGMNMPREVVDWYLARFQLFMNSAELARRLNVSRLTVDRWASKNGLPLHSYWRTFQREFHKMIDGHRRIPDFGEQLAETLAFGEPRRSSVGATAKSSPSAIRRWLRKRLEKRGVKYSVLQEEGRERGYTRSQLHYASNKLGVIKDHKGLGRGSFTVWSLP